MCTFNNQTNSDLCGNVTPNIAMQCGLQIAECLSSC